MVSSSAPKSVVPKWCHVASMLTAILNQLAKLVAMTYGAETYYLGVIGHDAIPRSKDPIYFS